MDLPTPILRLSFHCRESSLSVRSFAITEEISTLFELSILARSENDDIDLESIVGKGAAFQIASSENNGFRGSRTWNGICSRMELVRVESTGLSTYLIQIVPALWRTTLRRNNRIFQHLSIPEIVLQVLGEWKIVPALRIDEKLYPKFEYRVQYDETDYGFLDRLLQEAGIAFRFDHDQPSTSSASGDSASDRKADDETRLVLCDRPQAGEPRAGGAIRFVDVPNHQQARHEDFVSGVRLHHQVRPGRVTIRDFNFRLKPDYQLLAEASALSNDAEDRYEQYHYTPGAFLVEPGLGGDTPVADDKGIARVDEKEAAALATRKLDAERRGRRRVSYASNAVDLAPGALFSMYGHPRTDLGEAHQLLVIATKLEGALDAEWHLHGEAVFTDTPYRPLLRTPKPRIRGLQSAVVVGPPGEEIHTDEFGRVRVQFHWDRQGKYDDNSSCWIRVSQSWAGSAYGMVTIPRVGQEVVVDFFEGDPDRPLIVGRVYNATSCVPYKLPENKTQSGWKSASSPGAHGFNELMFEDARNRELIHIQAQKDYTEIVKNDQHSTVLRNRSASITSNDSTTVGANQSTDVGANQSTVVGLDQLNNIMLSRSSTVGEHDFTEAGTSHTVTVGSGTGSLIIDKRIVLTTGGASIVIDGDDIFLDAKGTIRVAADQDVVVSGKSVYIDGGPMAYVNCTAKGIIAVPTLPAARAPREPAGPGSGGAGLDPAYRLSGGGVVEDPGGYEETAFDGVQSLPSPSAAPAKATMPFVVSKQIRDDVRAAPESLVAAGGMGPEPSGVLFKNAAKAVEYYQLAAQLKSGGAAALPAIVGQNLLGPVFAKPVEGLLGLAPAHLGDMLKAGNALGLFHLAHDGAISQLLAVKTQAAPAGLDGSAIRSAALEYHADGMTQEQALAKSLHNNGVALYQGDLRGTFNKLPVE